MNLLYLYPGARSSLWYGRWTHAEQQRRGQSEADREEKQIRPNIQRWIRENHSTITRRTGEFHVSEGIWQRRWGRRSNSFKNVFFIKAKQRLKSSKNQYFYFRFLIWPYNVFLNLCVAYLPVRRDIKTKFTYFLFWTCMCEIRNTGISSLYLA